MDAPEPRALSAQPASCECWRVLHRDGITRWVPKGTRIHSPSKRRHTHFWWKRRRFGTVEPSMMISLINREQKNCTTCVNKLINLTANNMYSAVAKPHHVQSPILFPVHRHSPRGAPVPSCRAAPRRYLYGRLRGQTQRACNPRRHARSPRFGLDLGLAQPSRRAQSPQRFDCARLASVEPFLFL